MWIIHGAPNCVPTAATVPPAMAPMGTKADEAPADGEEPCPDGEAGVEGGKGEGTDGEVTGTKTAERGGEGEGDLEGEGAEAAATGGEGEGDLEGEGIDAAERGGEGEGDLEVGEGGGGEGGGGEDAGGEAGV